MNCQKVYLSVALSWFKYELFLFLILFFFIVYACVCVFNVVYQLMTKYYTSPTIFRAKKIKIIKNSIVVFVVSE